MSTVPFLGLETLKLTEHKMKTLHLSLVTLVTLTVLKPERLFSFSARVENFLIISCQIILEEKQQEKERESHALEVLRQKHQAQLETIRREHEHRISQCEEFTPSF